MSRYKTIFIFLLGIILNMPLFSQLQKTNCTPPAVNFEPNTLCFGQTTFFKNLTLSSETPVYNWLIFKPNLATPIFTSSAIDLSYKFQTVGTYTIHLTATNPDGHFTTLIREVTCDSIIQTDFFYENCQNYFVNFSGCADSYYWDFGDSTYSTEKSPKKTYKSYGLYTVKLIAKRGSNSDTIKKVIMGIPNILTGKFSYLKSNDTLFFQAHDTISYFNNEYHWLWGDGNVTSALSTDGLKQKHVYKKIGRDTVYNVMLVVRSLCYNAFSQTSIKIKDSTMVNSTMVYPNPLISNNLLRIFANHKAIVSDIEIIDFKGKNTNVYQVFIKQNGVDIDFSDLPPGIYYVRFKVDSESKSYKIIKK
ncbi:MAG: PKD domain-containing protein [Sphingobacteriaceae bacterium]